MTRKDFEFIAATIKQAKQNAASIIIGASAERAAGAMGAIDFIAESFANRLAGTNKNFDRERFLVACGAKNEEPTAKKGRRK